MLIMKFGGTSVTHLTSVLAIKRLVQREITRQPVLVVSALSGTTDLLVKLSSSTKRSAQQEIIEQLQFKHSQWVATIFSGQLAKQETLNIAIANYLEQLQQLLSEHKFTNPAQLHDSVVAFGEIMSSFLITSYLNLTGIKAQQVVATKCIVTNQHFGGADFKLAATRKNTRNTILPLLKDGLVPVITGFIAATSHGETTTLGRGGSDYSAAIIAYALLAEEIQIWTDVDGVYSADPRVIADAKLIDYLSYQEAAELAMFGAKILHPRTIQPAVKANIPVRVLNTFNLANQGTLIKNKTITSGALVKAITWRRQVPLINIYSADMFLSKGFLQKIFAVLARNNISVNMLSASEVSVSVTLDQVGQLDNALLELNRFAKTEYSDGYGTISLVGEQIMTTPSLMQDVFDLFEATATPVEMLSYSASNINISMIIPSAKINSLVPLLHKHFIPG